MNPRTFIHSLFLGIIFSSQSLLAQKNDKAPDVPLTLSMLEKCMYMGIDTVEKIILTTGFAESGTDQEKQILIDKWKPNRMVLLKKGKVDLVIIYSSSGVYHFILRSESAKEKIGEELFNASFKAGYKEITHTGENPRVMRSEKKEIKYNTQNKPWTWDLNEKK